MTTRIFLTAIVAGLVCAQALAATPPATPAKPAPKPAATPAGPWSKVPALPTVCYSSQDKFWEQNNAAIQAVSEDHERQKAVNDAIGKKLSDAMSANPMAQAQAMQQEMMNDPQNAQKYMERMLQQGQQAQAEIPAMADKDNQFEAESKTLIGQYKAALGKALAPDEARQDALWKKLEKLGFHGEGEADVPPWAIAESNAILKHEDNIYAAHCATWWSATGPIHAYMKRYKDFLIQERIPTEKEVIEAPLLESYKRMNVPTAGWRTTTDYAAAESYMRRASDLFNERQADVKCHPEDGCK